jgi:hypothetical protein
MGAATEDVGGAAVMLLAGVVVCVLVTGALLGEAMLLALDWYGKR